MALIICVVGGINPFPFVGTGVTPTWYDWLISNKLYAGLMIFFLCNAVETQLISTGAFEIRLDNLPVWSKIESGRIPQPPELFQVS
jgi:selT/selW/selH-like putative selenoprotein